MLFFFGVGSIVLRFLDREFIILSWIDNWGLDIGWVIRCALAGVGGILLLVGSLAENKAAPEANTE